MSHPDADLTIEDYRQLLSEARTEIKWLTLEREKALAGQEAMLLNLVDDPNLQHAWNTSICCNGHECGCQGATVYSYLLYNYEAIQGTLQRHLDQVQSEVIAAAYHPMWKPIKQLPAPNRSYLIWANHGGVRTLDVAYYEGQRAGEHIWVLSNVNIDPKSILHWAEVYDPDHAKDALSRIIADKMVRVTG